MPLLPCLPSVEYNRTCSSIAVSNTAAHAMVSDEDSFGNRYEAGWSDLDDCSPAPAADDEPSDRSAQPSNPDQEFLISSRRPEEAFAELVNKFETDFFSQADQKEREKRMAARQKEDSWWVTSMASLTEMVFEYLSNTSPGPCGCNSPPSIKVFTIDIKGINRKDKFGCF